MAKKHVDLLLARKRKPCVIVPVANDPTANPNKGAKGWLPLVLEGHIERMLEEVRFGFVRTKSCAYGPRWQTSMNEDDDFLSMDAIEKLARESNPANYELIGVRFETGAIAPIAIPGTMIILIEFRSLLQEDLTDTPDAIRATQEWSNFLIAKIRTRWPRDEITIGFHERSPVV